MTMTLSVVRDRSAFMRHDIRIGAHSVSTDLSVAEGGEDLGVTPHDLYDAALGACKALTMMVYAKRKGIPLEDVRVNVTRDASEERAGIYRLQCEVSVTGPLTEAHRAELLRVAQKCPIHKLMAEATTEVTTTMLAPG
jgi:putative redox protein